MAESFDPFRVYKTPKEAFQQYGFEEWISWDDAVAHREVDDLYAVLFGPVTGSEVTGSEDPYYWAVELNYNPFRQGWEVGSDWTGPFSSIEEFETGRTVKSLW